MFIGKGVEKGTEKETDKEEEKGAQKGQNVGRNWYLGTRVPEEKEIGGGKSLPFIMEHNECGQWVFLVAAV